jgi:transcriptional regulator with XRE-family HTH domain
MEKLKAYIAQQGISAREFAARVGMSPAGLHGLMNKRNAPSLAVAFKIEDATGGDVPARSWLDTQKETA